MEKESDLDRLRRENDTLRALIPAMGQPCVYCGLAEIARCSHGFPGCMQADDLILGQEEHGKHLVQKILHLDAENKALRGKVILGFYENGVPEYSHYPNTNELCTEVNADEVNNLVRRIKELSAERQALYDALSKLHDDLARSALPLAVAGRTIKGLVEKSHLTQKVYPPGTMGCQYCFNCAVVNLEGINTCLRCGRVQK